jgi:hypothetical protein
MDRLKSAKHYVWSPMQIGMYGTGSDAVAHAGRQAKVVVDITGGNDETMQHVELLLKLGDNQTWPLAKLPATLGRHEVTVELPTGLPPSSEYTASPSRSAAGGPPSRSSPRSTSSAGPRTCSGLIALGRSPTGRG